MTNRASRAVSKAEDEGPYGLVFKKKRRESEREDPLSPQGGEETPGRRAGKKGCFKGGVGVT